MKKLLRTILLTLLSGGILLSSNASAAEWNLKMQSYLPPSLMIGVEAFIDRVEKMSNGRVKIQLFTGGELVAASNILKSIQSGMIDIAQGMGHHFSEMTTGTLESGLPMSWLSPLDADVLYNHRGLRNIIEKEYEKAGVVWLGTTHSGTHQVLSKEPINNLDDLRRMKIRAVGGTAKVLAELGANPVNMPVEDIYLALTTGQIDGVIYGNANDYLETKFYEAAKYLNLTPFLNPTQDAFIVNKKVWDSFPPDIQEMFRVAVRASQDLFIWAEGESMRVLGEEFVGKTTTFSAEDQKEIFSAALKVWDDESKKSPEFAKGVEIVKQFAREKGLLQ